MLLNSLTFSLLFLGCKPMPHNILSGFSLLGNIAFSGIVCIIMYEYQYDRWDWFLNADRHRVCDYVRSHACSKGCRESPDLFECDKE
jgi:hypothetical protein